MLPKNRKFHHSFRNKTKKAQNKIKCEKIVHTAQGLKTRFTENNPLLAYTSLIELAPWLPSCLKGQKGPAAQKQGAAQKHVGKTCDQLVLQSDPLTANPCYDPDRKLRFGGSGIYFLQHGTICSKFIDSVKLTIARKLKKTARFWIRLCADTPVTERSAESRMGRGKGAISYWESKVKPGQTFLEFSGDHRIFYQIFKDLQKKTPIPIQFIGKR